MTDLTQDAQQSQDPQRGRYDGFEVVDVSIEGSVATVFLNNPPINLYTQTLVAEVSRAGRLLGEDPNVRAVVVRSAVPGFFIAHADVTLTREASEKLVAGEDLPLPDEGGPDDYVGMFEPWRTMPKPTIAVVEGRCAGGGVEFIQSCDMQFAADTAIFNQWEVSFGIVPGAGGLTRLARRLGRSRAMEALLGCDDFSARTAAEYGWINRALPPAELDGFVDRLVGRIVGFPECAVASAKEGILHAVAVTGAIPDGCDEVRADLKRAFALMARPEVGERITRFLELGGQTVEGEHRFGDLLAEV